MASAIFMPFRAHSTFIAECRSADTSMVSRFILAVIIDWTGCSRTDEFLCGGSLSYFIISDCTTKGDGRQGSQPGPGNLLAFQTDPLPAGRPWARSRGDWWGYPLRR